MVSFGVRMSARARRRHRLLVDVLDDRGEYRMLVGDGAFADDELGGGADCLGDTCQVAHERGTGHVVDVRIDRPGWSAASI
jgi:hypothetical protein